MPSRSSCRPVTTTGSTARICAAALDADPDPSSVFAVVGTAGRRTPARSTTLDGIAARSRANATSGFHVDGAYGLAALAAPSVRNRFRGIEHRGLPRRRSAQVAVRPRSTAPALVYRTPELARLAHTQHAGVSRRDRVPGTSGTRRTTRTT